MATVTFVPTDISEPAGIGDKYTFFCRFPTPTSIYGTITAAVLKCWVQTRYSDRSTSWSFPVTADWSSDISWNESSDVATLKAISFTNISSTTRNYAGSAVNTLHSYDILGDGTTKGVLKSYNDGNLGFSIRILRNAINYSGFLSVDVNDPGLIDNSVKNGDDGLRYYDRTHGSTPVQVEITYTPGTPDTAKGYGGGGNVQFF